MRKKALLKIIRHYGINKQQKYIHTEYFELDEAITTHEMNKSVEYEIPLTEIIGTKDHIAEELADCLVMLKQIQYYYDIDDFQVKSIMNTKIDRQLQRIKEEKTKNKQ
jgi:NTP pyrophosphatase (non-canonical NTP hydrolase)